METNKSYGTIYKVTNKINDKIYIGQTTTSLKRRWKMHKTESRKDRKKSALHYAINKYGVDNFIIEPICSCLNKEELNLKEIYFINTLNSLAPSGYNLKMGGNAGKWSKLAKDEFSELKQKQYKENPQLSINNAKYVRDWWNNLTDEQKDNQLKLQTEASREYWSDSEHRFKKADQESSRWKELSEEQKDARLKGFREFWTEDKLKEHSNKMKDLELWKTSGCLQKAQEITSKKVRVIEIITNKETLYSSRAKCTKALKMTAQTLIDILSGKRSNEYKGYRFLLIS